MSHLLTQAKDIINAKESAVSNKIRPQGVIRCRLLICVVEKSRIRCGCITSLMYQTMHNCYQVTIYLKKPSNTTACDREMHIFMLKTLFGTTKYIFYKVSRVNFLSKKIYPGLKIYIIYFGELLEHKYRYILLRIIHD